MNALNALPERRSADRRISPAIGQHAILEAHRLREFNKELLAALTRTLDWLASYPGGGTMRPGGPYEQARAAIAKATQP